MNKLQLKKEINSRYRSIQIDFPYKEKRFLKMINFFLAIIKNEIAALHELKLKELENSGSIETKPEDPEVLISIEINVKQLEENLTFELDYWVNINKYAQRMQGLIDDVQIQTCYNNILLSKKQILSLLKENINSF